MNVRFFAGTRAQYDRIVSPSDVALYFCTDTRELFLGSMLLTDGMRVVPTFADLPTPDKAADGVVYYVTETRNGYVVPHGGNTWLQTIYAPVADVTKVPESEVYNTVTTVGAVRDIATEIYSEINSLDKRIANIEIGSSSTGVNAIYFAGKKLDAHDDGTYHIDRMCALRALGFVIPDDQEEFELVTKEYVDAQIKAITGVDLDDYAKKSDLEGLATEEFVKTKINEAALSSKDIDLSKYYTKDEVNELIPDTSNFVKKDEIPVVPTKVSELENDTGYITAADLPETDLSNYYNKSETEALVNEMVNGIVIPDTSNFITMKDVEDKGYLTEHQSIEHLATKEELQEAIRSVEHPQVDLDGYATEAWVAEQGFLKEHQDLSDYATKEMLTDVQTAVDNLGTITPKQKYEVLPFAGALINYTDTEVRVNTQHVDINSLPVQNAGDGSSSTYYYITFIAYAPEGATRVLEGQGDVMDTEYSYLATDRYGRKYTTIWAAIAKRSGNTWIKYGDMSFDADHKDKYLGFYYNFHWYKEDSLIGMDKVRLILTNDACHNDLVPDAVARRIYDKTSSLNNDLVNITKLVQNIENNYVTNEYIENNYTTSEQLAATYVTNAVLTEKVEATVTEVIQEKVEAGDISVKAESISYDTF